MSSDPGPTSKGSDSSGPASVGQPVVSVIIATRDRPEMLREAIESVRVQTYGGVIETVVVFDQTEPDESLISDDSSRPVIVTSNSATPGLPGARNSGVAASSGEFLAFCDDDDLFLPSKTEHQVRALLAPGGGAEVVVCGIEVEYKGQASVPRPIEQQSICFDDLLRSRIMQALFQTAMLHRDAWAAIGPDDEQIPGGYGEDYEWLLRASKRHPLAVVGEPLVRIRWSGGSFFANRWRTIDEALAYLLAKYPEFSRHGRGHARILGQRAFALAAAGDRKASLGVSWQTVRAFPGEPRAFLAAMVALRIVKADSVIRWLNSRGRGM